MREWKLIRPVSLTLMTLLLINMLTLTLDINVTSIVCGEPPKELANSLVLEYNFPFPVVTEGSIYDSVVMSGIPKHGAKGEPILPFKVVKALLPQGKDVQNIDVTTSNRIMLEGSFNVEYGKTLVPVSSNATIEDVRDQKIYSSASPFPGVLFSQISVQHSKGYKILIMKLHPVQYIPKKRELFYFETMTVTLRLKQTGEISPFFRNLPQDRAHVLDIADNPNQMNTYTNTATCVQRVSLVDHSHSYVYVIITDNTLSSSFQPLIDWKLQKGLNATVVLLEDILNDPAYHCDGLFGDGCGTPKFNDTQAHIRNFLKDAYQNWGTEYVLLGGDTEIIPARGVCAYVEHVIDYNIACDMYYGALDGSWDNDNDTRFGEGVEDGSLPQCHGAAGEEADFFAEVYVGRAPVETPEEATNFVYKTLWYEQSQDNSYFKNALMVGETLDRNTEGANGKDLVTNIIPQYTTTRLYDRDGTFSGGAVFNKLNSGTHIVNHFGHANRAIVMGLLESNVDNLTNDEYFMVYSIGCYSAAFDLGTEETEAIAEHFLFNPNGAFAYIGNTRYGWYMPGTTNGPGDRFDREFFSMLSQGERSLGKALQLSKENLFGRFFHRWTCFTLVLLGDPETQIVTEIMAPTAHFKPTTNLLHPAVLQGNVQLRGTVKKGAATGATFDSFKVEFGLGRNPTSWLTVGINLTDYGSGEIENGVLGTWDTRLVTSFTIYTLKLTVFDEDGRIGEDRWIVHVEPISTIQVNPCSTEIHVGQTLTVEVYITNIRELHKLDVQFTWNATLVDYVSHTVTIPVEEYANGILHGPVQIVMDEVNQTAGKYLIAAESEYSALPFDGSGSILEIAFEVKAVGTCALNVSSSNLFDKYGQPINHKVIGEIVRILPGVHDVAVTNISINETAVCQGLSVDVNVIVENQGSFSENFDVTVYSDETSINTTEVSLAYYSLIVITFTWNTTEVAIGNYTISAVASAVPGENDTADNNYVYGVITIREPVFDVAVRSIILSKTVVGQRYIVSINVTVENQGDLISTFNVTVYADLDITVVGDDVVVGIQSITLKGGNSKLVTFAWNTTSFVLGNYTITAHAEPITNETDIADNTLVNGWIIVTIPGDVNGDFDVDIYEIVGICTAYGSEMGDSKYKANLDIDGDGKIDIYDLVIVCDHYGETNH